MRDKDTLGFACAGFSYWYTTTTTTATTTFTGVPVPFTPYGPNSKVRVSCPGSCRGRSLGWFLLMTLFFAVFLRNGQ